MTGRLAFNGAGGIVITRADGLPLQYDRYELVLADEGFVSLLGSILDGDLNGIAGADYHTTIVYSGAAVGRPGVRLTSGFRFRHPQPSRRPRPLDSPERPDSSTGGALLL